MLIGRGSKVVLDGRQVPKKRRKLDKRKQVPWMTVDRMQKEDIFEGRYEEEDECNAAEPLLGCASAVGGRGRGEGDVLGRGSRNVHDWAPNGKVGGGPEMDIQTPDNLDRHFSQSNVGARRPSEAH